MHKLRRLTLSITFAMTFKQRLLTSFLVIPIIVDIVKVESIIETVLLVARGMHNIVVIHQPLGITTVAIRHNVKYKQLNMYVHVFIIFCYKTKMNATVNGTLGIEISNSNE